jgi:hypothetical protein
VKSIYSISINKFSNNIPIAGWESAVGGVEYLIISHSNLKQQHGTKVDYDFRYLSIGMLKEEPQLNRISGRCS